MWANDDRLRKPGRLKNIVPAARGKAATDNGNISKRVNRGEFSDGIEQENTAREWHSLPFGAPDESGCVSCDICHGFKSFRMTRREDEESARKFAQKISITAQEPCFFAFNRAAGDNHRSGAAFTNRGPKLSYQRRFPGRLDIEFQVAADVNASSGCADFTQAPGVFGTLAAEQIDIREHAAQQSAPAAIARERAIADARVYYRDLRSRTFRETQEVRPEFGLG